MPTKKKKRKDVHTYQLKVTLLGIKPPIWRRLQVPGDVTLEDLHYIVQISMGWHDGHMHAFTIGAEEYANPMFQLDEAGDESEVRLADVAPTAGGKFRYVYDFGDDWQHEILVEKIIPPSEGVSRPTCVKGARACPPEDSGGVWGYAEHLEALSDPKHEEHGDSLEWLGEDLDPEAFDPQRVNRLLMQFA